MSTLLAIDLSATDAEVVTLEALAEGGITLLDSRRVPLAPTKTAENAASEVSALQAAPSPFDLLDIDSALAIACPSRALFQYAELPFDNQRKLDEVMPLHLQDQLPFAVEDFVVNSLAHGKRSDGRFDIVSTLLPRDEVEQSLADLKSLGADPKVLTLPASAVSALSKLFPEQLSGTYSLLVMTRSSISLVIAVDGQMKRLREFPREVITPDLVFDVRCTVQRVEHDFKVSIEKFFAIGNLEYLSVLITELRLPFTVLDLSDVVKTTAPINPNEYAWAVGLAASQISEDRKAPQRLFNFRVGEFAYKPAFSNILNALREEWYLLAVFGLAMLLWLGVAIGASQQQLAEINTEISDSLHTLLPAEPVPPLQESQYLQTKLSDVEEQLSALGSLSSLSPLDSLKELSTAITPSIDLDIESISIGRTGLTFRGSVSDFPAIGRLSTALETRRGKFCEVRVNSGGRVSGSSRVKYNAELNFCD